MVRVFTKIEEDPAIGRHGQVFTKPHVVALILDLCGYRASLPLHETRLLDPGCGDGAFIAEALARLLKSLPAGTHPDSLSDCLLAVEKDPALAQRSRERLERQLIQFGFKHSVARKLSKGWVANEDFLASETVGQFDFVVGNPPYVRQEAIPKADLELYRQQFSCFFDRADLYMAFIEKSLRLLSPKGVLGFICPNRFARNRYGQKLRSMIVSEFRLTEMIDLGDTSPFEPEVLAYPGIFVIRRGKTKAVSFVQMRSASEAECKSVVQELRRESGAEGGVAIHRYADWFEGDEPWITESPEHLALIRRLEETLPTLGSEASGTRVGIGVATGADSIFIVDRHFDEVEPELLVPLAMTSDCLTGEVVWEGRCVINPFKPSPTGGLIDLDQFPLAQSYFEKHRTRICKRNVSKRSVANWYRTIDRINVSLIRRPKLLIPDIKASNTIIYEPGKLYPHHNLYFVVSDYWDMLALRTILRSSLAKFFVWVYGVKMRSGWLRFQAQYLRRIRIPSPLSVSEKQMKALREMDRCEDMQRIDAAVARLYDLSKDELVLIRQTLSASPQPSDD